MTEEREQLKNVARSPTNSISNAVRLEFQSFVLLFIAILLSRSIFILLNFIELSLVLHAVYYPSQYRF